MEAGPNIAAAGRQGICERFYALESTGDGWGPGLAIAEAVVELHHGRIWVESEPGWGAAFHVALPVYPNGGAS